MSIAPTEHPLATLNATHRCDRCSNSRAYVLVLLKDSDNLPESGELYFCVHHADQYKEPLAPYTRDTIDERWQLTEGIRDDGHVH